MVVVRALVALFVCLGSSGAFASFPATQHTSGWLVQYSNYTSPVYATQQDACVTGAPAGYFALSGADSSAYATWDGTTCTLHRTAYWGGPFAVGIVAGSSSYTCPSNATLSGSSCSCNTGYAEDSTHTSCVSVNAAYCNSVKGPYYGTRSVAAPGTTAAGSSVTFCVGSLGPASDGSVVSCEATGTIDTMGTYDNGTVVGWVSRGSYTGNTCGSSAPRSASTPTTSTAGTPCNDPSSCPPPAGQCPGTVNGVTVWKPCGSSSTSSTKTDHTTNPDGTQSTVSTGKQTTCGSDGNCATTTTTTTTNGTNSPTTSTTTTTQSKSDYCAANPKDVQCAGSGNSESSFGGSCEAGFTCSGDAATCAIAKASWDSRCVLTGTPDTSDAAYVQATTAMSLHGADPSDHPGKNPSVVDLSTYIDKSNPYSSSCPGDYTIVAGGPVGSIVVPLSSACSVFVMMGNLLVGLTLLASALWLVKGQ